MSRTASTSMSKNRPSPLSSKSFARYEPPTSSGRHRASTVASPVSVKSTQKKEQDKEDVFEKPEDGEEEPISPTISKSTSLPDRFEELPVELASLTDRFVESLSAKVFNEPPSIDQLSELFQEFYIRASASISIHISALMSRINRDRSPSSRSATLASKKSVDALAPPQRASGAQQMLTASEVTEKRRARRLLEYKRVLLEEAVERRVCEKIYTKIWRHKSTLDEVSDEKLRSKTAALALVGIGLKDLGIEIDEKAESTAEDLQESLAPARECLAKMSDEHFPLGKLQHLTTAHKAIVDTLSAIKPSSSSADEILPTLIYALITSPIEGINIISNLNFIQRFRTASKIDGEAAYCLTNLEAAISFLENVDLASLRDDERPEGPDKPSGIETPLEEKPEPFPAMPTTTSASDPVTSIASVSASIIPTESEARPSLSILKPPTPRHQRTLSDLLQPISNAQGAVRTTAEESLKNISSTLDNSFKVLFGKLRERSNEDANAEVIVPKTLDEARQLVSRPLTPTEADDTAISETSSLAGDSTHTPPTKLSSTEEKVLGLFGGRRRTASLIRDRSADSQRSTTSSTGKDSANKKVAFAATGSSTDLTATQPSTAPTRPLATPSASSTTSNPLDTVKTSIQSMNINPLNNISSAFGGAFRSFGRQPSASTPNNASPRTEKANPFATLRSASADKASMPPPPPPAALASASGTTLEIGEEISLRAPTATETAQIRAEPAKARYMACVDAGELRVGEVAELLRDYQRLGRVLEGLRVVGEEEAEGGDDEEGEGEAEGERERGSG